MRRWLPVFLAFMVFGCSPQMEDAERDAPRSDARQQFPDFCADWDDCDVYCHSFSAECEAYCAGHQEVAYCSTAFGWLGGERPVKREGHTIFMTPEIACSDDDVRFGTAPIASQDYAFLLPLGFMGGGHVSPTDHHYFMPREGDTGIDVRVPGDGAVVKVERLGVRTSTEGPLVDDYNLVVQHSCDVFTNYIHVTRLSEKLASAVGDILPGEIRHPRVVLREGELLGVLERQTHLPHIVLDFSVADAGKERYVVNPDARYYTTESPWHRWIQDAFTYFEEDVSRELQSKLIRSAPPLAGRIHYDVDGKLVGNWFKEEGDSRLQKVGSIATEKNNLAFAYDYLDPSVLRIGIGHAEGGDHFGAVGPDPATIGVGEPVQYALGDVEYYAGRERWNRANYANVTVDVVGDRGTLLVELVDDRRLRMQLHADTFTDPTWYVR